MSSVAFFLKEEYRESGQPRYVIMNSHKVMYSTMRSQEKYGAWSFDLFCHLRNTRYLKPIGWFYPNQEQDREVYLIVRHPHDRLMSLYRNAIMYPLAANGFVKYEGQLALFTHVVAMCRDIPFHRISKSDLLTMSFEEFVLSLPKSLDNPVSANYFLLQEEHTRLQTCNLYLDDRNMPRVLSRINPKRTLKMEHAEDMLFLRKTLMVDTSIHKNKTAGVVDVPIEWSDEMRAIVYKYYKPDFKNFGYKI